MYKKSFLLLVLCLGFLLSSSGCAAYKAKRCDCPKFKYQKDRMPRKYRRHSMNIQYPQDWNKESILPNSFSV